MEKLHSLETFIRKYDYSMTLLFDPMRTPDDVEHVMDELHNRMPAAVVILDRPPLDNAYWIDKLSATQIPFLFIDSEDTRVDSPHTDREQGICDAVEYLASIGKKRIAYIGPVLKKHKGASARLRGYNKAIQKNGLPQIIVPVEFHLDRWEAGQVVAEDFLELTPRPDAVQVYSDELAMAFMYAVQKHGVKIPQDVAVMGFDGRRYSRFASPPLSTVKQPNEELGQILGDLVIRKIKGDAPPECGWSPKIKPKLVIRQST